MDGIAEERGSTKLRRLPPERLEEAAELAADALADNPLYAVIHDGAPVDEADADRGRGPRQRFLRWIFERNIRLRVNTSINRAVCDDGDKGGKLVAFFMFLPPGTPDVGFVDLLRVGFFLAPFTFGLDVVKRMLSIKDEYERVEREVMAEHGNVPMYRLERMAVRTDVQGRGIGTNALRQALVEADKAGHPVLLATQKEQNVRFYGRLGFEVVDKREIAGCAHWSMIRQPSSG